MKKKLVLTLSVLIFGTQTFAKDSYPDRNKKQLTVEQAVCTKEAMTIATSVGFIVEKTPADVIKSVETYSETAGEYETQEQHIWTRDAELVVNMLPNYYGDGKCQFSSSYIHRD